MWHWNRVDGSNAKRQTGEPTRKPGRRLSQQPQCEALEDRQLLAATLQSISNLTVPAQQGYTQPLLAATGQTAPQTFTVTSSNPDIAASIVQGQFWTLGISYTNTSTTTPHPNFTGSLTFQLFNNLTPNTAKMIDQFTNDGYYVNTGKYFPRIVTDFGGTTFFVVQGGSNSLTGSGNSGQPGTPFANENLQQLPLSGINQIAMANSGGTDSNDTQFFINTGSLNSQLGYGYTVFGQMLTGTTTLGEMTAVPVMNNTVTGEHSQPVTNSALTITSATLSDTNPNGTLLIDTTQAQPGETSTITVTAHQGTSTTSQSFTVTVGAYGGPASPTINFRPFANATTADIPQSTAGQVQLNGQSGYPNTATPSTLTYALLSQPTHGTVSNFNASTGTFTYTPDTGFLGRDSLTYQVTATGPETTPATTVSNPGKVTIVVGAQLTGDVQIIGQALVVQPPPKFHGKNHIHVAQVPDASANGGAVIQVNINGQLDATQPGIDDINRIIVFGGRTARNQIVIDPSVQVSTTIDSGHGNVAFLTGGGGPTREHGWFGHTTLIGGPGPNQLIGLAGKVKFKPTKATTIIFAGKPRRRTALLNTLPPGGTFYKFIDGHLVPIPDRFLKGGDFKATLKHKHKGAAKAVAAAAVNPGGPMIPAKTSVLPTAI